MRDRLIELLQNAPSDYAGNRGVGAIADHLIANNVFVLPEQMKDSWELTSAFVLRLFCANEEEVAKIKQEFEYQKIKQILTDIRDYLVKKQQEIKKQEFNVIVKETALALFDAQIVVLKEYAEKLGVEL